MSWIEKIQNKTQPEKMRIIWTVAAITAVLLILVWIISAPMSKNVSKDTTLFQTIGTGFKDLKNNLKK